MDGTEFLNGWGYVELLEGKRYQALDKVLSFVATVLECVTERWKSATMTSVFKC